MEVKSQKVRKGDTLCTDNENQIYHVVDLVVSLKRILITPLYLFLSTLGSFIVFTPYLFLWLYWSHGNQNILLVPREQFIDHFIIFTPAPTLPPILVVSW